MDRRLFVNTVRSRVTSVVNVGNSNLIQEKGFVQIKSRLQLKWVRQMDQRTLHFQLSVRPVYQRASINGFWIVVVVPTLRVCGTVLPPTNEFPIANTGFVLPTIQRSMPSDEVMSLSWYRMMEGNGRWS